MNFSNINLICEVSSDEEVYGTPPTENVFLFILRSLKINTAIEVITSENSESSLV
jgi:hypothetical protein